MLSTLSSKILLVVYFLLILLSLSRFQIPFVIEILPSFFGKIFSILPILLVVYGLLRFNGKSLKIALFAQIFITLYSLFMFTFGSLGAFGLGAGVVDISARDVILYFSIPIILPLFVNILLIYFLYKNLQVAKNRAVSVDLEGFFFEEFKKSTVFNLLIVIFVGVFFAIPAYLVNELNLFKSIKFGFPMVYVVAFQTSENGVVLRGVGLDLGPLLFDVLFWSIVIIFLRLIYKVNKRAKSLKVQRASTPVTPQS